MDVDGLSNQSEVYRLRPEARSRLTTGYMCVNFTGGVVGSASSAAVYDLGGWSAVCAVGFGFSALALVLWCTEARWPLRRMRHPQLAPEPDGDRYRGFEVLEVDSRPPRGPDRGVNLF